jgi:hypothetical protein
MSLTRKERRSAGKALRDKCPRQSHAVWQAATPKGYFEKNDLNAYLLNILTAKSYPDGSFAIQVGGPDKDTLKCLSIAPGGNYTLRFCRSRAEILNNTWKFPEAKLQRSN